MQNRNGIEYMIKKKVETMGFTDTKLNQKITKAIVEILEEEKIFKKKKKYPTEKTKKILEKEKIVSETTTNKWNPGCPRASSNTFGDNPDWGKGENWCWLM